MELDDYKDVIDALTQPSFPMKMAENETLPYLRSIIEKQEDQIKELQAQLSFAKQSLTEANSSKEQAEKKTWRLSVYCAVIASLAAGFGFGAFILALLSFLSG